MTLPLFVLSLLSIFVGYCLKDGYIGFGSLFLSDMVPGLNFGFFNYGLNSEFSFASEKAFPLFFSIFFSFFACFLYSSLPNFIKTVDVRDELTVLFYAYSFFSKKWYFDQVYNSYAVYPVLRFGHQHSFKTLDRGVIELLGPTGFVRFWLQIVRFSSMWQSGYVFNYVFSMVVGLLVCISFVRLDSSFLELRFLLVFSLMFLIRKILLVINNGQ